MPAAKLNMLIEQGSTYRHNMQLRQGSETAPPLDLTGCQFRLHIRSQVADAVPILALTTENGGIVVQDALQGSIQLHITAAATGAVDFDSAVYDLEIVSAGGDVTRLVQGLATLSKEVTR